MFYMSETGIKKYIKDIPNLITMLRIAGTVCLLFQKTLSVNFFIIYIFAGVTDVLDGWLARKLNVTSTFGARLDSAADLMFYSIMVIKIFPDLLRVLPVPLWIFSWSTVFLRVVTYMYVAIRHKRFASIHTYMNKLTGGMMFLLPCMLLTSYMVIYSWISCTVAFLASVEEMIIHIMKKTYDTNVKSLLFMRT